MKIRYDNIDVKLKPKKSILGLKQYLKLYLFTNEN